MYTMSDKLLTNPPITDRVREAMAISLRGCDELLPQDDWLTKLARSEATGVPLRIKLGLDPTAPDIHIGHTVVLNKMRQLQDLGHTVIFLIGDFTALQDAIVDEEWIFHAASQDLPCLQEVGLVPTRIFDTELGARIAAEASLEEWKAQPAQREVPRDGLVAEIRRILDGA